MLWGDHGMWAGEHLDLQASRTAPALQNPGPGLLPRGRPRVVHHGCTGHGCTGHSSCKPRTAWSQPLGTGAGGRCSFVF